MHKQKYEKFDCMRRKSQIKVTSLNFSPQKLFSQLQLQDIESLFVFLHLILQVTHLYALCNIPTTKKTKTP